MKRPPKFVVWLLFAALAGVSFVAGMNAFTSASLIAAPVLIMLLAFSNYLVIINIDYLNQWGKIIPLTYRRTKRDALFVVVPLAIGMILQALRLLSSSL
ncbi:MAG: hypothetical protein M1275_03600 [Patescibacteria group bacterium]|nr:hypothetical protein [Patescibacteria group bacterium]